MSIDGTMSHSDEGPALLGPLPGRRILSLLLTLRCTAECGECGTHSGPHVRGRIDEDVALRLIDEAASGGYDLVAFTGGEPMLYGVGLRRLVGRAHSFGIPTRMVSNAYWALDVEKAKRRLRPLVDAGLGELNVSTGDEHARFVPPRNVLFAARAGLDLGLIVAIMIETRADNHINKQSLTSEPLFAELFDADSRALLTFCESPWMPLDEAELYSYPEGMTVNHSNMGSRAGCDSVIDTTTVLADDRIMACCGLGTQSIPELHVGTVGVDSLAEAHQRSEGDFLKRWIRDEGPERILAWAARYNERILWEDMYAHRCQACKRVYSDPIVADVLREHYEEKILDVLASEWLMHTPNVEGPGVR